MNFLFICCVLGAWILISLFDISREANKIATERSIYKNKKGGTKPIINWTKLAIRSFFLLIICILIIYTMTEIISKIFITK